MAIKVVIPGVVFTDTSLPVLSADSLLTTGSLLLLDFGREETLPLSTTPANGTPLGNLAWDKAAALLGSGDATTLGATWESALAGVPSIGLVERTSKKGVHVITSQTVMDAVNRYAGFSIPAPILAHIHANLPSRSFYVSLWLRQTRLSLQSSADAIFSIASSVSPTASFGMLIQHQPAYNPAGAGFVGANNVPATDTLGNSFRNLAANGWTGTKPALGSTEGKFWFGAQGAWRGFQEDKALSGIIYRCYIEDLTASGRSYATVNAADKALYDVAFGAGGRFASDTFTAVSTIP